MYKWLCLLFLASRLVDVSKFCEVKQTKTSDLSLTMAPPPPLACSDPACTYSTPSGTPTWELMVSKLSTHTHAVHGNGGGEGPPSTSAGQAPRLEKLPRPTFQLDMTISEWAFKHSQWKAYISQTVVQEATKVQQLRAACTDDLLRRVYDAGDLASMNTEELLMH